MKNSKVRLYDEVKAKEMIIDIDGYSFLCIFGEHINGGFLAIPNWNICTKLGDANDISYNSALIYNELAEIEPFKTPIKDEVGEIAYVIAEHIKILGY